MRTWENRPSQSVMTHILETLKKSNFQKNTSDIYKYSDFLLCPEQSVFISIINRNPFNSQKWHNLEGELYSQPKYKVKKIRSTSHFKKTHSIKKCDIIKILKEKMWI